MLFRSINRSECSIFKMSFDVGPLFPCRSMSVPAIGARALGSFSKPVAMDAQVVYGLSPGLAFQESPELLVQDRIDLRRFLEIMEQRDASRDADMASLKSLVESQKAELQSFRVLYSSHKESLDDLQAIVNQEKGDRELSMNDFRQDLLNHGLSRQTIDELMGDLRKDMDKHATSVGELRTVIDTNHMNMNGRSDELYNHINVSLQGHAGSLEALKLIVEKEKKDRELTMIDFRQDLLNHGVKGKDLEAIMGELKTDMNKHVSSVGQLGNIVASTENIPSDGRIDIFYERMTVLADKVDRIRTDLDIEMSRREIQYRQVVVASPAQIGRAHV